MAPPDGLIERLAKTGKDTELQNPKEVADVLPAEIERLKGNKIDFMTRKRLRDGIDEWIKVKSTSQGEVASHLATLRSNIEISWDEEIKSGGLDVLGSASNVAGDTMKGYGDGASYFIKQINESGKRTTWENIQQIGIPTVATLVIGGLALWFTSQGEGWLGKLFRGLGLAWLGGTVLNYFGNRSLAAERAKQAISTKTKNDSVKKIAEANGGVLDVDKPDADKVDIWDTTVDLQIAGKKVRFVKDTSTQETLVDTNKHRYRITNAHVTIPVWGETDVPQPTTTVTSVMREGSAYRIDASAYGFNVSKYVSPTEIAAMIGELEAGKDSVTVTLHGFDNATDITADPKKAKDITLTFTRDNLTSAAPVAAGAKPAAAPTLVTKAANWMGSALGVFSGAAPKPKPAPAAPAGPAWNPPGSQTGQMLGTTPASAPITPGPKPAMAYVGEAMAKGTAGVIKTIDAILPD